LVTSIILQPDEEEKKQTHETANSSCTRKLSHSNQAQILSPLPFSSAQIMLSGPPGAAIIDLHASSKIAPSGVEVSTGDLPACTPIIPTSTIAAVAAVVCADISAARRGVRLGKERLYRMGWTDKD
jgi:hypothetical protein